MASSRCWRERPARAVASLRLRISLFSIGTVGFCGGCKASKIAKSLLLATRASEALGANSWLSCVVVAGR